VIDFETKGSLYPVTTGLQFLSVQASAVSIAKGEAMREEALNVINTKYRESSGGNGDSQDWNEQDHHPYPDHDAEEQKEEAFAPASNRKSTRNRAGSGNTNSQQATQTNTAPPNNQQARNKKGNQFLALGASDEDIELCNDPSVVAAATQSYERKADAGDFDTSKDWRITNYLKDKWNGYRPEQQIQSMTKLVVTIWAREHSDYHTKQLGNNFTGAKKLGGLLSAIGRSKLKSLKEVTALLKDNVRNGTDVEKLCSKLNTIIQEARDLPETNPQPQPQQQPTSQSPNSSTNGKQSNQPLPRPSNKIITPNTANKNTITNFFNPLATIPIDLTSSQESNTQVDDHMQLDGGSTSTEQDHKKLAEGEPSVTAEATPPPSPLKMFNSALGSGFNASAAASLSMLGGMPATKLTSSDPPATGGSNIN
jgi:hypothetical protein